MRPLPSLALALLLALPGAVPAASAPLFSTAPSATARVAQVIDGDTVVLASGAHLRYIGIDAPEVRKRVAGRWTLDPQPFSEAATWENRRLVEGRTVRLEFDAERNDRYGRTLAYVFVGDVFVNARLVEMGLARARAYPPDTRYRARLEAAQRAARAAGRGLWGPPEGSGGAR
jgi:micrococcal nuclease